MIYYPPHRKYVEVDVDLPNDMPPQHIKTHVKREEWKLSITLSWVIFWHMCVIVYCFPMLMLTALPFLQCVPHLRHVLASHDQSSPGWWIPLAPNRALGDVPRSILCHPRHVPVYPTDRAYMAHQACRRPQHPNDVHSDPRSGAYGSQYRHSPRDQLDKCVSFPSLIIRAEVEKC